MKKTIGGGIFLLAFAGLITLNIKKPAPAITAAATSAVETPASQVLSMASAQQTGGPIKVSLKGLTVVAPQ